MSYYITYTGKHIDMEHISTDDICIEDIAHHLTNIQRYNGAIEFPFYYSVAQHSINLALYLEQQLPYAHTDSPAIDKYMKYALLHDATETYLGDLIGSLKKLLPDYCALEKKLETIIFDKYDVDPRCGEIVKLLDKRIVLDEGIHLFPSKYKAFREQQPDYILPLDIPLYLFHTKMEVKTEFLKLCKLCGIDTND